MAKHKTIRRPTEDAAIGHIMREEKWKLPEELEGREGGTTPPPAPEALPELPERTPQVQ